MGMEYRHYNFAINWKKAGHNVLIIAASNHHLRSKQFSLENNTEKRIVDDVDYLILKAPDYQGNNFSRIYNILTFLTRLIRNTSKIASDFKPDVVIASSTFVFDIFPAKRLATLSNAKLVFEVKDLWPLSIIELGGYSKWHPYIFLMQLAENYAYRNADKVVSVLPKALDYLIEHGLKSDKFVYIPNGVITEDWNTDAVIPEQLIELINKSKSIQEKIIAYAGNLGIANALVPLVNAMELLRGTNVVLFIIGNGPESKKLKDRVNQLKINNVYFIDAVPRTVIPSLLDKLDILYIGLQNQPVFRFGISPNKLMDYMMAGKPIIQAIKAGNDITKEAQCGVSIEPENSEAIAEAVKYLLSLSDEELKRLGSNGRDYCLKHHDYNILSEQFLKAVTN